MESVCPQTLSTSPRRGEVDLLLAMQSIVQCKSGEGALLQRETATPHPRLSSGTSLARAVGRDLSLWARWTSDAAPAASQYVML
jgi:hypothetical protein